MVPEVVPTANDCAELVKAALLAAPAASLSDPQGVVPFVWPLRAAVPESVMFPLANGVPADGRTRRLPNVTVDHAAFDPVPVSCAVMVNVTVEVVRLVKEITRGEPLAPL